MSKAEVKSADLQICYEDNCKSSETVGLSYSPNLTAIINSRKYINGEGLTRVAPKINYQSKIKPPEQGGQRICDVISNRANSRIRKACRIFQYIARQLKLTCALITLTFGSDYPDDTIAKKLLDNFLKRLRRHKNNNYYLWVAERQKRGAIHFHILTDYTDKDFINKAWNEVVNRWQKQNELQIQKLFPNVIQVRSPAKYLSKYITKEAQGIKGNLYGMSRDLSKALKPIYETNVEVEYELTDVILEEASKSVDLKCFTVKANGKSRLVWSKEGIIKFAEKINQINNTYKHE